MSGLNLLSLEASNSIGVVVEGGAILRWGALLVTKGRSVLRDSILLSNRRLSSLIARSERSFRVAGSEFEYARASLTVGLSPV